MRVWRSPAANGGWQARAQVELNPNDYVALAKWGEVRSPPLPALGALLCSAVVRGDVHKIKIMGCIPRVARCRHAALANTCRLPHTPRTDIGTVCSSIVPGWGRCAGGRGMQGAGG